MIIPCFLLFSLSQAPIPKAFAQENVFSYTDTNSVRALRILAKITAKDPATLSETEGAEWARARFAEIALLRLEGKVKEAAELFAGCGIYCEMWGALNEWPSLKAWGCSKLAAKERLISKGAVCAASPKKGH